jgi:hypothetical protein
MEKVVRIFHSFEEADKADRDYYRSLTPQQRLDLAFALHDRYYGATKLKMERVIRVIQLGDRDPDRADVSLFQPAGPPSR